MSGKVRLATVWLDGCSGCHMSFLDMDERILDIADRIELLHSPICDVKAFPENVDLVIIEGVQTLRPGAPVDVMSDASATTEAAPGDAPRRDI